MAHTSILLLALAVVGAHAGSYLITSPMSIQRGSVFDINVDILNTTGVRVEAKLQSSVYNSSTRRNDVLTLQSTEAVFGKGTPGVLSLPIATDLSCTSCSLRIRGRGGLQFESNYRIRVSSSTVSVLIQTDKAMYKPGEKVRFRALAVFPDLTLYTGEFNIQIKDPRNNIVKNLLGLSSSSGVVESSLDLSDQPLFGDWTIHVALEELSDVGSQTFTVKQYELPRFEVTVELPPYGLVSETQVHGKVKVKYTFGQPVKGVVELHTGPNTAPDMCGKAPASVQTTFDIDGEAQFTVPHSDISRVASIYDGSEIKVTAIVKETTTGVRLEGSSVMKFHSAKFNVKFLENTPSVFKPGLPYTAFVQATTPDGMPPAAGENTNILVYTLVNYELKVPDQAFYSANSFSGSYPLPGQNLTLPANGVLPIDLDIPSNASSITIKVTYNSRVATKTIQKMYSKSNNFVQLSIQGKNIRSGQNMTLHLKATEPMGTLAYELLSRGRVVTSSLMQSVGESTTIDLLVTPAMAPTAHLLAYYVRDDYEVVADSLAFNVEDIFENKVSIEFSTNQSEPHKSMEVLLEAEPGSQVNLLAVDQSVLLLKSGNDITADKVSKAVGAYDHGKKPTDSEFALSYSSRSVSQVFSQTGLRVFSDVDMNAPSISRPSYRHRAPNAFYYSRSFGGPPGMMESDISDDVGISAMPVDMDSGALEPVSRTRNIFPEAWLWSSVQTGPGGKSTVKTTVPDTITSWIASAFATHHTKGLGVAPTTAKLEVFRPFFVSLSYPRAVTRNEKAVLQATVFNYLPNDVEVVVTLKPSPLYTSITITADGTEITSNDPQQQTIRVASDEQGVVYFPVQAEAVGVADVEVSAQTSNAADAVRRQIIIKSEGAPVSFNVPSFINLDSKMPTFRDTMEFPLPPSAVSGSASSKVKVTGDLVGSSLKNLNSLVTLPTGCGEQSMVKFAPDLYIAQYLRATGQLTSQESKRITALLSAGYQRQLNYQRFDKSYSAFGNYDETGSTWLTAYVARVLNEARDFIYVDPNVLVSAVDWLVDRQRPDGSFAELGKVLDSTMQGTGPSLTAYVLLTMLRSQNLASPEECSRFKRNCHRVMSWGNSTANAVTYLENEVADLEDKFSLALVSYALSEARSHRTRQAFDKLLTKANTEGSFVFWNDTVQVTNRKVQPLYRMWRPPVVQARPISVLITSYALMTYISENRLDEALPTLRWLTMQRNTRGGFVSSQDTAVALESLAKYAQSTIRPDSHLTIDVTTDSQQSLTFSVNRQNALSLQVQQTEPFSSKMEVSASGSGFALAEFEFSFNINDELSTPAFDVSTVLLDDTLNAFNLMICTKWLWDRKTGMVVQEIGVPSGFSPELSSLGKVVGLKRSEMNGDTVAIYFDQIGHTSTCYSLEMTRTAKVANTERSYVRTYDYYEPDNQATVFYQPRKLRDSTICDVCDKCCYSTPTGPVFSNRT